VQRFCNPKPEQAAGPAAILLPSPALRSGSGETRCVFSGRAVFYILYSRCILRRSTVPAGPPSAARPTFSRPPSSIMFAEFVPLFIMIVLALGLAFTLLKAAEILGPSRPNKIKRTPYESGMDPVGSARERYSVKFYLVAMIFIVFDVEVVFMYPWAVSFQDFIDGGAFLGVMTVVTIFSVILMVGLLYDIKKGGLDFEK
jgi:NADH-quinone oxidoreductase subunit A